MNCILHETAEGIRCRRCGRVLPVTTGELAQLGHDLRSIHARCRKPGLGDRIAAMLALVGITEARLMKWLGGRCACAQRRERLNRLGWRVAQMFGRSYERNQNVRGVTGN